MFSFLGFHCQLKKPLCNECFVNSSECERCIALLEASVRVLLHSLETMDTNSVVINGYFSWEVEEGVKCAYSLRRIYEEVSAVFLDFPEIIIEQHLMLSKSSINTPYSFFHFHFFFFFFLSLSHVIEISNRIKGSKCVATLTIKFRHFFAYENSGVHLAICFII